jgi:hypothetical protein
MLPDEDTDNHVTFLYLNKVSCKIRNLGWELRQSGLHSPKCNAEVPWDASTRTRDGDSSWVKNFEPEAVFPLADSFVIRMVRTSRQKPIPTSLVFMTKYGPKNGTCK